MLAAGYSYRYTPLSQLSLTASADWLAAGERAEAGRLHDRGRRIGWLAGRLLVKQLLLERLEITGARLAELEIRSRDAVGRHIRPHALWKGRELGWSLSISHSNRGVLAALAPPGACIGVDLVCCSAARLGAGFEAMWFTTEERARLAQAVLQPSSAWGAKEAAYKALNHGEPFTPRQVRVQPSASAEFACRLTDSRAADCRVTIWRTPQAEFAVLATCPNDSSTLKGDSHHD